ncbi:MAG: PaaI family thioesterase, partial [Firmicutes bacterium]|nr:PaaI family thioesterase [Bacillota bacterium]
MLTREEMLELLADCTDQELAVAVTAASAQRKASAGDLYFLHHFYGERLVAADARAGEFALELPIAPALLNPAGMVHGGVIATLCDDVMGFASHSTIGRPGVTLDMTVRYHRPGRGTALIATARIVSAARLLQSAECTVRDDQGRIVATASGAFYHRQAPDGSSAPSAAATARPSERSAHSRY